MKWKSIKFLNKMKFIDIGANLEDPMFQGIYNRRQVHPADLQTVLNRAWSNGMDKIIVTVGTLKDFESTKKTVNLDDRLFMTVGCHPTRCNDFLSNPDKYYADLCTAIDRNRSKVVAIGEFGLDYDRLKFCDKETQKIYFSRQLDLAAKYKLPMFLHCRNSFNDFYEILTKNSEKIAGAGGVVHSFDGTVDEAMKYIEMGLYIGINGCSLKTEKNLKTVKEIPIDRIMIETDCPWCSIRPSHAGSTFIKTQFPKRKKEKWSDGCMVDGRCEPSQIVQVVEILAGIYGQPKELLAKQFYENTINLFFKSK